MLELVLGKYLEAVIIAALLGFNAAQGLFQESRAQAIAELVRSAHVVSSRQKAVLRVVRKLAAFNGVAILMLIAYAYFLMMPRSH